MTPKEKIIAAAMEAFLLKGIKNVTMDSIAQAAGVSKRTVYELFTDKDALAIETIRQIIISDNKDMIKIIGTTDNVIEALFNVLESESTRRSELSPVFVQDMHKYFPAVNASFQADPDKMCEFSVGFTFLQKGIEQGMLRKDLKIGIVDNYLHEMVGIIHTSERLKLLKPNKADILNNIFLPYFRGICTRKGLALMDKYFENLAE